MRVMSRRKVETTKGKGAEYVKQPKQTHLLLFVPNEQIRSGRIRRESTLSTRIICTTPIRTTVVTLDVSANSGKYTASALFSFCKMMLKSLPISDDCRSDAIVRGSDVIVLEVVDLHYPKHRAFDRLRRSPLASFCQRRRACAWSLRADEQKGPAKNFAFCLTHTYEVRRRLGLQIYKRPLVFPL